MKPQKRLGEILIDDDIITQDQLKKALDQQREGGGFLGQILIEQSAVSQDTLISYLAKQCQIPHLSLLNYRIGKEALAQVPKELCLKYYLIPVDKMGRILTLAMVDPLDTEALDEIKKYCPDLRIKPVLCSWEHFQTTVKQVYAHEVAKPDDLDQKYEKLGAFAHAHQAMEATVDQSALGSEEDGPTIDQESVSAFSASALTQTVSVDLEEDKTPSPPVQVNTSSTQDMAAAIREAIQDTLSGLVARSADHSAADFTSMTKNVQQLLEDTLGKLAEHNETSRKRDIEALAKAVQDSVFAAISATRDVHSLQQSELEQLTETSLTSLAQGGHMPQMAIQRSVETPADQENQLAIIAQAILDSVKQTAQLVEAHTVAGNNQTDMIRHRQTNHNSVAPFMSSEGGTSEILLEEDDRVRNALTSEYPLETLTFDNFFAGKTNNFTVKLAQAVAENPGGEYNPLFLYGKVGIGKTHLISAIGNANINTPKTADQRTPRRIGYISASHFARRLMLALADDALELFRDNYCHWDMLILDDIQFLGGRVEAQEEFFHIFNVLQQQQRQIVIAGDKAPDRLGMLEQRLVSRFASGVVADLKPPEWETRMTILRYHADQEKVGIPEEVLSLIAVRVPDDIRKMNGALRKIIAFSRLEGGKISVEDAQRILAHLGANEAA